jgi:2-dehydro-3-deoxyphosphogluconate aldolase / (4S)-4-hydroxy-2-oxoglutarate aldolase
LDDAAAAIGAGADLIIAPGSNRRVIDYVRRRGVMMVPGVMTPTEIEHNLELGLRLMKFFPAEQAGGVAYLRTLNGPYPNATFVPTGGIGRSSLPAYLTLPSVAFCAGTWIAPATAVAAGDMALVAGLASEAVATVAQARAIRVPRSAGVSLIQGEARDAAGV